MTSKKKNNRKKLTIMSLVVFVLALAIVATLYSINFNNKDQPYSKPAGWLTYRNKYVPFTFDYSNNWDISKGLDDNNKNSTYILASDNSTHKQILSVRYSTYVAEGASEAVPEEGTTYCKTKHGDYANQCSYITNPSMKYEYLYGEKNSNIWDGIASQYKTVDGKSVFNQAIGITISLLDDTSSSKNDLINLAKSIKPVSE